MRSRNYTIVLYPEDETHVQALDTIKNQFSYAYILHNKDKYEKDEINEDTGEIEHKRGELKKEHWHVLITFPNARSEENIKAILGNEKLHIEKSSFYEMTRYLIHLDSPHKYQYNSQEIITNIPERINNALAREIPKEEEKAMLLLNYIFSETNQGFLTFKQLTQYAIDNDCLGELQKKTYFYNQFIDKTGFNRW